MMLNRKPEIMCLFFAGLLSGGALAQDSDLIGDWDIETYGFAFGGATSYIDITFEEASSLPAVAMSRPRLPVVAIMVLAYRPARIRSINRTPILHSPICTRICRIRCYELAASTAN